MPFDLKKTVQTRLGENYALHERHLNSTLVAVQRIIGFDQVYARAEGAYLYDREGRDYLDFLCGYSVFNIGRNHPAVKKATARCARDGPAEHGADGLLAPLRAAGGGAAEEGARRISTPSSSATPATESMEGAIKFARAATGRAGLVSFKGSFHGLTNGSLSVMGDEPF